MRNKLIVPIIITGAKRSGTTLLQRLLDSIPNIFNFLDEAFFLEYLYDIGEENVKSFISLHKTANIDELIEGIRSRQLFPFFKNGYTQGKGVVNKQHFDVYFDMVKLKAKLKKTQQYINGSVNSVWDFWLSAFIECMGYDASTIKAVILKSPDYGKSALSALKYLTKPKILILIRDPRYAIDSLKRSRELRKEKELHLIEFFNVIRDYKFLKRTIEYLELRGLINKIMVIKYEEFVENPEKTMRAISSFINIPFTKKMLQPTFCGKKWFGESSFNLFDEVSIIPKMRKILKLTDWEIQYINNELCGFMKHFKYADATNKAMKNE